MRFSIGIPIHNEEQNIGPLLERLRSDGLVEQGLQQVVVVSSGSTDGSERIVAEFAGKWPQVTPLVEYERRGKASAINVFLRKARDVDRLVVASGDVLPAPGAVMRILAALDDPEVGMAAGRPVPVGEPVKLIQRVVRLQWELHHRVSLVAPKLGEVVAFRNVVRSIPTDTAVDEASLEAALRARGYRFAYVADAVIANKGPDTLADFLKQRRRIAAGHRHLRMSCGYRVSTTRQSLVLRAVAGYLARHPAEITVAVVAAVLEAWGRLLGAYDLQVRHRNPYIWDVAASTKNPSGLTDTVRPNTKAENDAELSHAGSGEETPTSWRMLLCLQKGTRVLEVSEDGGERAVALRESGAEVVCLRPSRAQTTALHVRGFEAVASESGAVGTAEAGRFDAVVLSLTPGGTRESGSPTTDLDELLREMGASLRPGGLLVLSLANPLFRMPGLAHLLRWLGGAKTGRRGAGWKAGVRGRVRTSKLRKSLFEARFTEVRIFAPLPEAHRPKFLVPIGDPNAIDYFFRFLMPRAPGALRRALLHLGRLVMTPGLFERLVPDYEVAAVKAVES